MLNFNNTRIAITENKSDIKTNDVEVKRGNLSDGLNNIATYLGLNPSSSLFMNSTVVNSNNIKRRIAYKPLFSHSEILSYLSRNKGSSAKGVCLYVNNELLNYLDNVNIAPKENIIIIPVIPQKKDYPYISVAAQLKKLLNNDKELCKKLQGYTIISSYLSKDEVDISKLINGNTLMDYKKQALFNSKYYLRKNASLGNYSIPLGVSFRGLNKMSIAVNKLKEILFSHNIDSSKAKIWCKFESQSGGDGSLVLEGLSNINMYKLESHIKCFSNRLKYNESTIMNNIPLVLEIDINSMPYENEIANIGVEAVISEKQVTLVGCVMQHTNNGKYVGSTINNKSEYLSTYAEQTAIPAFLFMQKEGYRGFITMDVLLTYDSIQHEIKGYNIDPNARFTAGTTLLSLLHYSENMSGEKRVGISLSNAIKKDTNLFNNVIKYAGKYLYRGKNSNFEGIIPIILNDISTLEDEKHYLRTVVIGNDIKKTKNMYEIFKKNIITHLGLY